VEKQKKGKRRLLWCNQVQRAQKRGRGVRNNCMAKIKCCPMIVVEWDMTEFGPNNCGGHNPSWAGVPGHGEELGDEERVKVPFKNRVLYLRGDTGGGGGMGALLVLAIKGNAWGKNAMADIGSQGKDVGEVIHPRNRVTTIVVEHGERTWENRNIKTLIVCLENTSLDLGES